MPNLAILNLRKVFEIYLRHQFVHNIYFQSKPLQGNKATKNYQGCALDLKCKTLSQNAQSLLLLTQNNPCLPLGAARGKRKCKENHAFLPPKEFALTIV